MIDECPLCRSQCFTELERHPYERIYAELGRRWKIHLSEDVRRRHAPAEEAVLVECGDCGLEYFHGSVPGDWEFYDQATGSPLYYSDNKWEFGIIADLIDPAAAVADLGAGGGAFLQALGERPGRLVGVDVSARAVEGLRAKGFEAHRSSFGEFAREHAGAFDVVTGFHIVEHLDQMYEFAAAAHALLRPGGRLFLSTPNRLRAQDPLEPLDCPPHHVSRWSPRQMHEVADRFGFDSVEVHLQSPTDAEVGRHVEARIGKSLRRVVKKMGLLARTHAAMARVGWVAPMNAIPGAAIMAELQKEPVGPAGS